VADKPKKKTKASGQILIKLDGQQEKTNFPDKIPRGRPRRDKGNPLYYRIFQAFNEGLTMPEIVLKFGSSPHVVKRLYKDWSLDLESWIASEKAREIERRNFLEKARMLKHQLRLEKIQLERQKLEAIEREKFEEQMREQQERIDKAG
jgi:CRISPR/Cas system-associated protein Csm6